MTEKCQKVVADWKESLLKTWAGLLKSLLSLRFILLLTGDDKWWSFVVDIEFLFKIFEDFAKEMTR